ERAKEPLAKLLEELSCDLECGCQEVAEVLDLLHPLGACEELVEADEVSAYELVERSGDGVADLQSSQLPARLGATNHALDRAVGEPLSRLSKCRDAGLLLDRVQDALDCRVGIDLASLLKLDDLLDRLAPHALSILHADELEIGRASCRERV